MGFVENVNILAQGLSEEAFADIEVVSGIAGSVATLAANVASITALVDNTASLNAISTSVVPNLAEILQADDNAVLANLSAIQAGLSESAAELAATTATTKAGEALASAAAAEASNVSAIASALTATTKAGEASASSATATTKAGEASISAVASAASAALAEAALGDITGLTASATTLAAGTSATASYDSGTGILYIGVPQGIHGAIGETGAAGRGISSVVRTTGDGSAGTTDTYTITYSDATTSTFNVYNGANGSGSGAMLKATYDTTDNGKVDVAEAAESVPWSGVSGKPSVYPPDTHNHDLAYQPIGSYLTTETDPVFTAWDKSTGISITKSQVSDYTDYTLPTATDTVLGGVKVGSNLTITNGVLSADAQNITVDSAPTDGSSNAVSSNGVFDALADKADQATTYTKTEVGTALNGKLNTSGGAMTGDLVFSSYTETVYNLIGAEVNPSNGTIQVLALSANITLTEAISNGQSITLIITGGSTYTVTWFTTTWIDGAAPVLTANDTLVFFKVNNEVYGKYIGTNMSV